MAFIKTNLDGSHTIADTSVTPPTEDEMVETLIAAAEQAAKDYADEKDAERDRPWKIKAANFNAAAKGRYQVNTSDNIVTVTLPPSATVGDPIKIEDATLSWATNNLTLNRNGLKINGGTSDYTADVVGGKLSVVYISADYGWSVK